MPQERTRFLPLIINARWIIIGYKHWDRDDHFYSVALIYGWSLWQKRRSQHISSVKVEGGFGQCVHERGTDEPSPFFLNLNTIDDVTQTLKQDWIQTARDEMGNASGSVQRQYHQPVVYKLITDLDYREQVLDEAFSARLNEVEYKAREGKPYFVAHRQRERSRRLVSEKKAQVLRQTGELRCEVCGFAFSDRYGALGDAYIECHHKVPLSSSNGQHSTCLEDLALVCSNCHSMLHRSRQGISVEQLREIVERARAEHLIAPEQ
jgi:5-methylcytosine-specific restriction endonuclease McrA